VSHPPVSLWEHRAAVARLRESGRAQVDEHALFRMVEQMRAITETATKTTRRARRDAQRLAAVTSPRAVPVEQQLPPVVNGGTAAAPFTVEEW
jgi:putative transposase